MHLRNAAHLLLYRGPQAGLEAHELDTAEAHLEVITVTERLQGGEKFRVNHPEIYGGSYSESGVQLLRSQARRWRKPIDFVGDISRTSQPDFACHHHIARRPERVNTRY